MNPIHLFFSFTGRAQRKWFWIGLGIIFLIIFNITLFYISSNGLEPKIFRDPNNPAVKHLSLLISGLTTWPFLALAYKRRHDLGKSGKPFGYVYVAGLFIQLMDYFSLLNKEASSFTFILLIGLGIAIAQIYMLAEMAFFKGTKGDNPWGPDPLVEG